jgi:hypothetical protein
MLIIENHQLGKNWILLIIPIYAKVAWKLEVFTVIGKKSSFIY